VTFRGFGSATVTNMNTNKTLTFNISGPGSVTISPNVPPDPGNAFAIDAHGPNLLYTTAANSFPDVPQLAYTTGHVKVHVEQSGITNEYELNGNSTNVCPLLA
jgi:hypothetical protein